VTSVVNVESIRFHEAIGFTVDATTKAEGVDGGVYVQMSRPVSPASGGQRPPAAWPPDIGTVLVGRDLEVRPTELDDSEGLFQALDAGEVWEHLTMERPQSVDEMRDLVARSIDVMHPWTVRLREPMGGWEDGSVVGWSSFLEVSAADARLEIGATAYAPSVWASTVNPETKLLLLGHAFDTLRFSRVQFKTDVRNERSQDAILRIGAVREGLLRLYQRRRDGSIRDTALFSITADEWPSVRDGLRDRLATPLG
jgi:RimJ/RimL family protein N-acetyltransferase